MYDRERSNRYRARLKGEDIPKLQPGPKRGYKQTEEHIEKRKRFASKHHGWKDDNIVIKSGRTRALRNFPLKPCGKCGNAKAERHHKDNNQKNNHPSNVQFLCRKCHMRIDGRLEKIRQLGKQNWRKAVAARWN